VQILASQFTLQTTDMGGITVAINSNTQFDGFDAAPRRTQLRSEWSVRRGRSECCLLVEHFWQEDRTTDDAQQAADDELEGIVLRLTALPV